MPVVTLDKADLYDSLGRQYTKDEFDQLCFEFGIELEEDSDEEPVVLGADGKPERPTIKIDIPANRYDLLCLEGITRALNIFLERATVPDYKLVDPPAGVARHVMTVAPETAQIRPYAAAAVLRGVKFDKRRYDSFIQLQDKLHMNLCRARSLVAIGTHDLSTVRGPFRYEARRPGDIRFVPLNQTQEMDGRQLMEFYAEHRTLSRFLPLIRDSPVYPVIYDSDDTVLSLPPIINGDRSKITLDTTDVFIESTATDRTKLEIVINIMTSMFSQYCTQPFTVEPVEIRSDHNGCSRTTPGVRPREHAVEVAYVNSCTGLSQSASTMCAQLGKMSMVARAVSEEQLLVDVPCTRADILHQCDIMEDVAIAYGYNNLPKTFPDKSATVGQPLRLNKLADILRREAAMAGFTEVMPLILCSRDENYAWLRRQDDGRAVHLANPKTQEYQVARTSLLPGCLKTVKENRRHALPIKVFEAADVVFKDTKLERGAKNRRMFCAVIAAHASNFEVVHGLLDRLMLMLGVKRATPASAAGAAAVVAKGSTAQNDPHEGYWIAEDDDPTFFTGRCASIHLRDDAGETHRIGTLGIVHPEVMDRFEIPLVASALEFDIERFL